MSKKQRKFADDGWAVWIDGDDTSTVYINDWINPKGKSYVDLAIRIRGVKLCKFLHVYIPFAVLPEEIEDVSLLFKNMKILQATFNAACIIDYKKNEYTSEIAYNGKTVDIVHISALEYEFIALPNGTLVHIDLEKLCPFLANDEAYFLWRLPHKSLDAIFENHVDVVNVIGRLRDLITTPVISEKYGYSIRVNEARLLPVEITRIGAFHRQKLKKATIVIYIDENYELNDSGCYRIRRLEDNLYENYFPEDFQSEDIITYQWNQNRDYDLKGHFNFYFSITKDSVSKGSMFLYIAVLLMMGVLGDFVSSTVRALIGLFS